MGFYGDPDELDALAAQLRERAGEVREAVVAHVRDGRNARWVSTAAEACREEIARDAKRADEVAVALERAAGALVAHAQKVREDLALIARFEHEVTSWFSARLQSLERGAHDLLGGVLPDPPWASWPVGPRSLPPSGDKRWLDVGSFMRSVGVL